MQHTGQVYLSKQPPVAGVVASGQFQLQMLAMDTISSRAKEPWRLIWTGPEAQAFWAEHCNTLAPGDALNVTCEKARVHVIATGRHGFAMTEIQAQVVQAAKVMK